MGMAVRPKYWVNGLCRHVSSQNITSSYDGVSRFTPTDTETHHDVGFGQLTHPTSATDMDDATQAIYDLAVEAQNKAGVWSFSHSSDAEGIYLLNENGLHLRAEKLWCSTITSCVSGAADSMRMWRGLTVRCMPVPRTTTARLRRPPPLPCSKMGQLPEHCGRWAVTNFDSEQPTPDPDNHSPRGANNQ